MTKLARRLATVLLLTLAFAVASAAPAHAQQFSASVVDADVTVQGDTAQATFKVKVTSMADEPMTDFWITFEDGTTASVGDIEARGAAVSDPQTRTVAITTPGSSSVPLKVTVKFSQGGTTVELPWVLNLTAQ